MSTLDKTKPYRTKIGIDRLIYNFDKYNRDPRLIEQHKKGSFYKGVLESMREKGMINPLLVIENGNKYRVLIGNNRLIAAKELGLKALDCIVIPQSHNTPQMLRAYQKKYYLEI